MFPKRVNLFDDDLTGYIIRPVDRTNATVMTELREMQDRAHAWGRKNQVSFDPGKESFQILHPGMLKEMTSECWARGLIVHSL